MTFTYEFLEEAAKDIAEAAAIKISKHTEVDEFLLRRIQTAISSEVLIAFSGFADKSE